MRCTQNPTTSEEWRRGWHPEKIPERDTDDTVLVVGAGPAGLEAARALGQRGYQVMLAEATRELGGRVARESRLPGLATWGRVRDYRVQQIDRMRNVAVYRESLMDADAVRGAGCSLIAIATGARWRSDGIGRWHDGPMPGLGALPVFTPDDIMAGTVPEGPVLIFDDDHYYMGGIIAEVLRKAGRAVTLVTPESLVSAFTFYTLEQARIQQRLIEMEVTIMTTAAVTALDANGAAVACAFTGREQHVPAASVVLVTGQEPDDALYHELAAAPGALTAAGVRRVVRIGDCLSPGTIAAAVYGGHRFARTLDVRLDDVADFMRENVELAPLSNTA
jgi:dimethylamine/trimethylamine dehydrogenase